MVKQFGFFLIVSIPLLAQLPTGGNSFQQNGWLRVPDPGKDTVQPASIDGQSGPVVGKPISASEIRRTVQTLSDGSHINSSETERFFRDSAGRMRTETATGALIFDPVSGFTYDLTTSRRMYTKRPVTSTSIVTLAAAAHRSSIRSSDGPTKPRQGTTSVTEDLPAQLVNGVYAKGVRITVPIPIGALGNDRELKVVNERWFSEDLEILVKSSNSDPRFGITSYELTNISQAPPDSALFQVPSGFSEGH